MTIYEPNPDIESTGEEAGEFVDPAADEGRDDDGTAPDSSARPSGSPPVE